MLRKLKDDHTSIRPRRGAFSTSVGQHREFHCFFTARMARRSSASHVARRTETSTETITDKTGRKKDETALEIERCALSALAFVAMATPASAGEYCRKDVTSAVVSCSFDTLAQSQDMSSGRGGDCFRDPFLPATSSAYAYQPTHLRSKKPVGKQ
jgi:hypothetical protein